MSEAPQEIGANSGDSTYRVVAGELRDMIERFEKLAEQKKDLTAEQSDIVRFAKQKGYDPKAFREIIRRRKQDKAELQEHLAIVELYEQALGIFG